MAQTTTKVKRATKHRRLDSRKDANAVVTSMVLPRELHRRASMAALDLNWSMAELVRVAVDEWLSRHAMGSRKGGRP